MTTLATCGHEITEIPAGTVAMRYIIPDHDLNCLAHAVSYQVLCPDCLRLAEAAGEILHDGDEEQEWLRE